MKTESRVLQKELTVPMLNILDGITDFRAFIIDAMEEYAVQARKDERIKVLEEISATCSNSMIEVKKTNANVEFNKGRIAILKFIEHIIETQLTKLKETK